MAESMIQTIYPIALAERLDQCGARISEAGAVMSFGDPQFEWTTAFEAAAIVPLPALIRIAVEGQDRARFLHNFCTNNVNQLPSGSVCEAFFGNVKARVLAHGLILAGESRHEIWMLPGNEEGLLDHLNRYIVTEDVALTSLTASHAAFAVIGPDNRALPAVSFPNDNCWNDISITGSSIRCLSTRWNDVPLYLLTCDRDSAVAVWTTFSDLASPAGMTVLDRLRILERFPLVGQDLSDDHLIPEAGRNEKAISYVKGCYLGQEPIARIDAMGQINRVLAAVELKEETVDTDSAAELTSFSDVVDSAIGLGIVRAVAAGEEIIVRSVIGRVYSARIIDPGLLSGA